jgi:hypothetical protein
MYLKVSLRQNLSDFSFGFLHRVHRVATAAFWRTFSDEGKISPRW